MHTAFNCLTLYRRRGIFPNAFSPKGPSRFQYKLLKCRMNGHQGKCFFFTMFVFIGFVGKRHLTRYNWRVQNVSGISPMLFLRLIYQYPSWPSKLIIQIWAEFENNVWTIFLIIEVRNIWNYEIVSSLLIHFRQRRI